MEYLNKDAAKTKPLKLARKLMLSLRTRESYGRSRNLSQIYAVDPPIAGKEYVHPSGLFRFSYREEELRLTLHSSEWPYPNEYLLFRITRREEIGVLTSRKAVNFMTEESNTKFAIRFAAPIMSISRATGISPPQLLIREPGLLYLLMRFIGR